MKIDRQELLDILNVVRVGTAQYETLEQITSFVFEEGTVRASNDEVFVRSDVALDLTGVVPAKEMHAVLSRLPDKEVDITTKASELVVKGKGRSAGIVFEQDIRLPVPNLKMPSKWKKLSTDLFTYLRQASQTCGKDHSAPLTTVVHVTPDFIEACDNTRAFRATAKTGFPKSILIYASAIDAIKGQTLTHIAFGKKWIYFKHDSGAVIAIRVLHEDFHDGMDDLLAVKGPKVNLPANLGNILGRAETMYFGAYDDTVTVSIEKSRLTLTSRKEEGWYKERKKIKYKGKPLSFDIHPKFLLEVLQRTRTVKVGRKSMSLSVGNVQFVALLHMKAKGK